MLRPQLTTNTIVLAHEDRNPRYHRRMLDHLTPPSSASRIKGSHVGSASLTPPERGMPECPLPVDQGRAPTPGMIMSLGRAQSTPPQLTNDSRFRSLSRGTDGDLPDASSLERSWSKLHLSKKRSQYYSNAFALRELSNPAKERVARDSVVVAEVKLNCCVSEIKHMMSASDTLQLESEQEFLIDLSFRLSEIYQRPASCIMVMSSTEVAMLIGGNSEPAYHLTITALHSEIAATKNKRSTHLIQDFMQESLGIKPKRGVVRFEPVAEENLATNGLTALQEIEQLQGGSVEDEGILRAISRQARRSKKSSMASPNDREKTPTPLSRVGTSPLLTSNPEPTKESASTTASVPGRRRVRQRGSILAFFGR